MSYLQTIQQWFKAQNKQQQLSFVVGLLMVISLSLLLGFWLISPSYGVLFNHLSPQDAQQILNQLEQANIAYKLRQQGSEVLIAKPLIDKTRIKLMSSDLYLTQQVGFELFDKSDFGMTDFSQKINYQRALQGELERTINSLVEVKQTRVHLVIPEHHLFQQAEYQPRAAVSLHLKRSLTFQQINSIQQLITASVAGMQKNNVIIVDQHGNCLTDNEEDTALGHFAIKKAVERYLTQKVIQLLKSIFGDGEVVVKIDVTLNYDELQREFIKPQREGIITHEKETQHSTSAKAENSQTNQDIMREKSYQFGSEKEHYSRASGNIERLTVSVVIPQFTNQQTIAQIERLVKSIVGFTPTRGDTISVEPLLTQISVVPSIPSSPSSKAAIWSQEIISYASLGCLGTFVVIYLLNVRSRRYKRQLLLSELTQWLNRYE